MVPSLPLPSHPDVHAPPPQQERGHRTRTSTPALPSPLFPHSCARHRNPATARLRRETTHCCSAKRLSPKDLGDWIPVTSTGMREVDAAPSRNTGRNAQANRAGHRMRSGDDRFCCFRRGVMRLIAWPLPLPTPHSDRATSLPHVQAHNMSLIPNPLFPHSCARHRNPATARLRRETTHRCSAKNFPPKDLGDGITVTSTGMREVDALPSEACNCPRHVGGGQ